MPEKKRILTPSRGYDFQVKIKDLDYSNDLRSVRIVSAINAAYQIVNLTISLDPNDLILEDVIGKEPIKMSVKLLGRGQENIPQESVDMELQYIKSTSSTPSKQQQSDGRMLDRVLVNIITVCRKPFKIMTSIVNDVFLEKTPKQIIQELVLKAGGVLEYDTDNENKMVIDQIILPPTTLYNTIRYLDNYFGLFEGSCNLGYCQYDGTVYIQNLTARMNKNQEFTIYQLALDDVKTKEIIELCTDGKHFYTYEPIRNQYSGPAKLATLSKNVKHIVKPKDSLFRIIEQNLNDVCLEYGAIARNPEMKFDPNLNDREVYNIDHTGNNESNTYANSLVARQIVGLATIDISLEKSLPILKLMKVGECVKLKCRTLEYVPLSEKYILKSSDLQFNRISADWQSTALIKLMRTNQYI